ncbi:PREDICTED: uncharacterized protein LOC108366121 [Rhagoletis zephyria]|uniref:uncharacterized protein LOC108366121 n=1 Tax=Rhagoletis zephyria TaxID=28612 RepID=UPI0008115714|nr:PREDICTED: uncharacterized protein LOC108366119 isoform X2 [Rhagoletis zephyria]XP_017475911.1 PREDICTED: uncharacterized protein LOC108366121 [Rhagoletis zephyria]
MQRNIIVTEEHITMVKEPNSSLIGFVTPTNGSSDAITSEMMDFLKREDYSLEQLIAINCDGTRLERPLQWFICLFHFNELTFTAVLKHFLGKASGPQNWPGLIGYSLQNCENLPAAHNFEPIPMGEMPENIDEWDLRADQKYLFNLV